MKSAIKLPGLSRYLRKSKTSFLGSANVLKNNFLSRAHHLLGCPPYYLIQRPARPND